MVTSAPWTQLITEHLHLFDRIKMLSCSQVADSIWSKFTGFAWLNQLTEDAHILLILIAIIKLMIFNRSVKLIIAFSRHGTVAFVDFIIKRLVVLHVGDGLLYHLLGTCEEFFFIKTGVETELSQLALDTLRS